jgi:hypothetical protein
LDPETDIDSLEFELPRGWGARVLEATKLEDEDEIREREVVGAVAEDEEPEEPTFAFTEAVFLLANSGED